MQTLPVASVWRRLFAMVYDALLLIALLMLAAAIAMLVAELVAPGLNSQRPDALRHQPLYLLWLSLWWFGYYAWCWRRGGQTVGMKAWRLKLVSQTGSAVQLWQCTLRLLVAGFITALLLAAYNLLVTLGMKQFGSALLALILLLQLPMLAVHEKLSQTVVLQLPKAAATKP